jgi:dicarboxylate transporter 10
MKVLIPAAAMSGFVGALIGNPADIANVRMQNDSSLAPPSRRNYRSVVDALFRIQKEEGLRGYYRGLWVNCSRAAIITSCQLASYDGLKTMLIDKAKFRDCTTTHLTASISASFIATTLCSPIDVIKTQLMSRTGGQGFLNTVTELNRKEGFRWLFRGWVPSFVRVGPHTIATLLFLEQHRKLYRK